MAGEDVKCHLCIYIYKIQEGNAIVCPKCGETNYQQRLK